MSFHCMSFLPRFHTRVRVRVRVTRDYGDCGCRLKYPVALVWIHHTSRTTLGRVLRRCIAKRSHGEAKITAQSQLPRGTLWPCSCRTKPDEEMAPWRVWSKFIIKYKDVELTGHLSPCCLTETDGEGKSRQLSAERRWQHIRASLNELSQVHRESKVWSYVAAVLSDILKSKWGLSAAQPRMSLRWQLQSAQGEGTGTPSCGAWKDNAVTQAAFLQPAQPFTSQWEQRQSECQSPPSSFASLMEPPLDSYTAFTKKHLPNLTFLPLMHNSPSKIGQFRGKNHYISRLRFFFFCIKIRFFFFFLPNPKKMTETPSINFASVHDFSKNSEGNLVICNTLLWSHTNIWVGNIQRKEGSN